VPVMSRARHVFFGTAGKVTEPRLVAWNVTINVESEGKKT